MSHGNSLAATVMRETRQQAVLGRAKDRERQQRYYATLSAKKKAMISQCKGKIAKTSIRLDRDRVQNQKKRMQSLFHEAKGAKRRIDKLEEMNAELEEKYLLMAEEPEVDESQAEAAEAAFKRACKDAKNFQKLTGETLEEFDEIWRIVEESLSEINYRGEKRLRSAGQRQQLPDRVQLFITLVFLRQYPTYALLSFALGGLSPLSLHHYIFRVLTALSDLDALKVSWPSDAEMAEHMKKPLGWPYPDKANIVAATDGTEIRVARPTKYAIGNKHYSAKKHQYALNVLLVVLLNGVIIHCSPPLPKMNDQALFNKLKIRRRFTGKPWGLIADSGFTLNSAAAQESIIGITPIKQPRGRKKAKKAAAGQAKAAAKAKKRIDKLLEQKGKKKKKRSKKEPKLIEEELIDAGVVPEPPVTVPSLTTSQKTHNVELSRMRVVVENTNARLKIYKVIGSKLRHYRHDDKHEDEKEITPALIMQVVAGLTNRHIKKTPCRSKDWVPEKVTQDDLESLEGSAWGDEYSDQFESDE